MHRRQVVHLSQLTTGDRFYIPSDKTKTVYEVRYHQTKFTKQGPNITTFCHTLDGKRFPFHAMKMVVFLRATNPLRKRSTGLYNF